MNQTFITNSQEKTLHSRLKAIIKHSQELKFLVGFFYFSGWQEIFEFLKERSDVTVKILVGLQVENLLGRAVEVEENDNEGLSQADKVNAFFESLKKAINTDEMDVQALYDQAAFFIRMIEEDRLILRKTAEPNHAKLYIFKMKEEVRELIGTRFITGSSNLTRAGLSGQQEFNVEIGDYGTEEAEKHFDDLWAAAVPVTEQPERRARLLDFFKHRSHTAVVTPFEAYLFVLKTYVELHEQKQVKPQVVRLLEKGGYTVYSYQLDAVNQALTILDEYNGVIIADVVGLGKSVIAGMVAKHTGRRGLILCPPTLMGDKNGASGWEKYRHDFGLYDWELRSSGDLESTCEYVLEYGDDIEVVVVDEAHRFRNQDTQDYEYLSIICRNRKVILLTATPFNNSPADIFAMLNLFVVPGKSKITLDDDLADRFSVYNRLFDRLSYIMKNYQSGDPAKIANAEKYYEDVIGPLPLDISLVASKARVLSSDIRQVLEPILIRRNRIDLKSDPVYSKEISALPVIQDPRELFYELSAPQSAFYDDVMNVYFANPGRFSGAIYQPFRYEKAKKLEKLDEKGNRAFVQQQNLYDFMRRLVVKRFESSFGAFRQTIDNFIRIHECVLDFIENSGGKYILDRKLMEKIYQDDVEEIEKALEDFAIKLKENNAPKNNRVYSVPSFDHGEEFLADIRQDLEVMREIRQKILGLHLVDDDPKAESLVKQVTQILKAPRTSGEPLRKVVIFSEYTDTVRHILPYVEKAFPGRVLAVEGGISAEKATQLLVNFDAGSKKQVDDFDILITSDKLSEGCNLNRAGAVINYDIPWNPTRVIQRVGRINRISRKVFDELMIFNAFPTDQGADVVKSRQIAGQKMFLIHNTLGEDAKIFEIDEVPTASELFIRINRNPDEMEDESLLTGLRRELHEAAMRYPEAMEKIRYLPNRIKTAKKGDRNELLVFKRKGLGLFIRKVVDTAQEKVQVSVEQPNDAFGCIRCAASEPRLTLSGYFWKCYEAVRDYREIYKVGKSDVALEVKAQNNLQSALRHFPEAVSCHSSFIHSLIEDLRNYKTLPKFTIRRLVGAELHPGNTKGLDRFLKELEYLSGYLGPTYLETVKKGAGNMHSTTIVAIENIK